MRKKFSVSGQMRVGKSTSLAWKYLHTINNNNIIFIQVKKLVYKIQILYTVIV